MPLGKLFIIFICLPVLLSAQPSSTEVAVRALFENPSNVQWLKHFKGRIDDINDISISLAYDGKACKGFLVYLRSRERFRLEGTLRGQKFLLKEMGIDNRISGYFEGQFAGDSMTGSWRNYANTAGSSITLHKVQYEPRLPSFCGDNKWIQQFVGNIQGEELKLIVQRRSEEELVGMAYSAGGHSYSLKGSIEQDQKVILKFLDKGNTIIGTLKGAYTSGNDLSARFYLSNGEERPAPFHMQQQLEIGCIEYADFISSYDITYPKSNNIAFNQWMDRTAMNWVVSCRNQAEKLKTIGNRKSPLQRASQRAYAWTDIHYLSDRLISGFIVFTDTWTNEPRTQAINFDLANEKEIGRKDLFKPKGKEKKLIQKEIKRALKEHPNAHLPAFKKWISREKFIHFTVREDGINFSTDYNFIFGQQHVLIPYEKIKPYINVKSSVWNLIDQKNSN